MRIAICTAFRNASTYVDRYMTQLREFTQVFQGEVLPVWAEGDSTDDTWNKLLCYGKEFQARVIVADHHGPVYTSVVSKKRFKQLAFVANAMWSNIPAFVDAAVLIDGDLFWTPETFMTLLGRLDKYPVVAPMVMHVRDPKLYGGVGPWFYDTFAFRKDGVQFSNNPPYHPALNDMEMVQVDSAGAFLVVRADLARQVHFTEEEVVVGLCKQLNACGATIWLDRSCTVYHPS